MRVKATSQHLNPSRYDPGSTVLAGTDAMPLTNRPDESLKVELTYRAIEDLKPPKRQLRTHNPKQVEQIVSSIRRMKTLPRCCQSNCTLTS